MYLFFNDINHSAGNVSQKTTLILTRDPRYTRVLTGILNKLYETEGNLYMNLKRFGIIESKDCLKLLLEKKRS